MATLKGTPKRNILKGTALADTILGLAGNDVLYGNGGKDKLKGGKGDDKLYGGKGNDTLAGEAGRDVIKGDAGNDTLTGGAGNDSLNGGSGTDTAVFSGAWKDYIVTLSGAALVLADRRPGSPDGTDTVTAVETFKLANGIFSAAQILNDAPLLTADSGYVTSEDTALVLAPSVLLANDTDADAPLGDTLTLVSAGGGVNGSVVISGGNAVFTPTANYHGAASFTYTVADAKGALSTATVSLTVNPVNDPAAISGDLAGAVAEDGTLVATGTLSVSDPDTGDAEVIPQTDTAGSYGTFSITAAGEWTYTLVNANVAVQALPAGGTMTDNFLVTSEDGTATETVAVTITGVNDAAVITGVSTGVVTEDAVITAATGNLDHADVDNDDDVFQAVAAPAASANGYGTYTVTAGGQWTFTLDSGNAAVDALYAGDQLSDTFTVYSGDGTAQAVTVTIYGANEPVISNAALYFSSADAVHGTELWSFDGETVSFVADIHAGSSGSGVGVYGGFVPLNGDLYFTASDATSGTELHKLDGTTGAVSLVADIATGLYSSTPGDHGGFVELNGNLYFTAIDAAYGAELRKLDGTTGAVSLVADIWAGGSGSLAGANGGFAVLDGDLYFSAFDPVNGDELRKLDGVTGAVSLVADIVAGSGSSYAGQFSGFAELNGDLYFRAYDPVNGEELRKLDGVTGAVTLVADIYAGSSGGGASSFVTFNGDLYFMAYDPVNGDELRKLDGMTGAVSLVADISVGAGGSGAGSYGGFTEFNGDLYFSAYDAANGVELRKLDDVTGAVSLVADISAGIDNSYAGINSGIVEYHGDLYFAAEDPANSTGGLYKLDGATGQVSLAADPVPGANYGSPRELRILGDELVFHAYDGTGTSLFTFDGATLVKHNPLPHSASSIPYALTLFNGDVYFSATEGNGTGHELHKRDGTTGEVSLVVDLYPGSISSTSGSLADFTGFNGDLYFTGRDQINGFELRKLDGVTGAVSLVADINAGSAGSNAGQYGGLVEFNGNLYFTATDTANGAELRKLDGTTGTVSLVADINTGIGGSNPGQYGRFIELNGNLYFTATDAASGAELRKLDGVTGAVSLVADISAGSSGSAAGSNGGFTALNGNLYFAAFDAANGTELRKLDGTTGVVSLVADIRSGSNSSIFSTTLELAVLNGDLYFMAYDPTNGSELRKLDGTTGAVSLISIYAGSASSNAGGSGIAEFNGDLYFGAADAASGFELRKLSGTTGVVSLVADINPGTGDSGPGEYGNPDGLVEYNGYLYFAADDGTSGRELHRLDSAGVLSSFDLAPGSGSSDPRQLVVLDGALYFTAATQESGEELWRYDGTNFTVSDINQQSGFGPGNLTVIDPDIFA